MEWDAVGAIAELLGAVAVIGTLVYLATQIKQSNLAARSAARLEIIRLHNDYLDAILNDPNLHRIFRTGAAGEELNEVDKDLFRHLMTKCFWYFSEQYFQFTLHPLTADEGYQIRRRMKRMVSYPGVQDYWQRNKSDYAPSFVEFFDLLIREDE